MNNIFVFKTDIYNETCGKLNDIDKEIFYDRSTVISIKKFPFSFSIEVFLFYLDGYTRLFP